ncbi:unnamed protein product [Arabidopsis lyrata]|nr:unnamed protein product [Arabidopsis lyrata]
MGLASFGPSVLEPTYPCLLHRTRVTMQSLRILAMVTTTSTVPSTHGSNGLHPLWAIILITWQSLVDLVLLVRDPTPTCLLINILEKCAVLGFEHLTSRKLEEASGEMWRLKLCSARIPPELVARENRQASSPIKQYLNILAKSCSSLGSKWDLKSCSDARNSIAAISMPLKVLFSSKLESQWIRCLQYLLVQVNTDVREAFCAQIGIFVQHPIHSLATAKDLLVIQTLLETTAQVMVAVDVTSELFLFCLFLLIDHPNFRACYIHHVKGGFATLLSRAAHIQNDLFDNLSVRLTSRPNVVREFAEAVLGVETEQLVRKMVPVVLLKDNLKYLRISFQRKCSIA